jgi:acyl dehydratase
VIDPSLDSPDRTLTAAEVELGTELPVVRFPLTVYRLVMWAGAGRDFNSIHHNTEWARATGAPEMYANFGFLVGGWERAVREWAGPGAFVSSVRGFRMRRFNIAGETISVLGTVSAVDSDGTVTVEMRTEDAAGVTVGPGQILVRLPPAASPGDF